MHNTSGWILFAPHVYEKGMCIRKKQVVFFATYFKEYKNDWKVKLDFFVPFISAL